MYKNLQVEQWANALKSFHATRAGTVWGTIVLSWVYAVIAQFAIWLPFGFVPIYLHPYPLFVAVFLWGRPAVYAFMLYILQGILGAPFFASGRSGITCILGPTGGYLLGMLISAALVSEFWRKCPQNRSIALLLFYGAQVFLFGCGLLQLSIFIAADSVFAYGLYPFIIGDFLLKPFALWLTMHRYQKN